MLVICLMCCLDATPCSRSDPIPVNNLNDSGRDQSDADAVVKSEPVEWITDAKPELVDSLGDHGDEVKISNFHVLF